MSENKKVILVIDDSKVIHKIIDQILPKDEYQLLSAYDSKSAVSKLGNNQIDIILLDITLPGRSGFDICSDIKQSQYSSIPIIFLTSDGKVQSAVKGLELGANDFIKKPFVAEELIIRIKTQLRIAEYQKEVSELKQQTYHHAMVVTLNHELNNPITILEGSIRRLKKIECNEDAGKVIQSLEDNIKRISTTIRKINELENLDLENYSEKTKMLKLS